MTDLKKIGVGLFVIGIALGLPSVNFLGLDFSSIPQLILTFMQISLIIFGIGIMGVQDE